MMKSVAVLLFAGFVAVSAQFPAPYPYQQQFQPAPYNPYQQYKAQPTPTTVVVKKIYGTPQRPQYTPVFAPPAPVYASPAPVYASPAPVYASPAPYNPPAPAFASVKSGVQDKDANVVAESREVNFDGTFAYGFDTDNGISVKSKGYLKNPQAQNEDAIQVIEGSYSFYDKEGKPVSISYIADEAGFRAFGDAIPTPPEEYVRAIANAPPPSAE